MDAIIMTKTNASKIDKLERERGQLLKQLCRIADAIKAIDTEITNLEEGKIMLRKGKSRTRNARCNLIKETARAKARTARASSAYDRQDYDGHDDGEVEA
jgi:hypothetical protein